MISRFVASVLTCSLVLAPACFIACGDDDGHDHDHDDAGEGGAQSSGGAKATGGSSSTGGKASGGTAGAGGGPGSGGSANTGGQDSGTPDSGDAGPIAVTLNFKAKVGTQDFECGTSYGEFGTPAGTVSPIDFRLFVQDVALIDADGDEVPVTLDVAPPWQNEKVAFLDFENATGGCASGFHTTEVTNTVVKGTVPAGTYKGVSFANGVPEDLNHGDPATLPEPLQAGAAMTWGWLLGFRFAVVEFSAALGGDAGTNQSWIHLGSTGCTNVPLPDGGTDYTQPPTTSCSKPNRNKIVLDGFELGKSIIVVDAGKLFADVDVSTEGQSGCHGVGAACTAGYGALGVNFATGARTTAQTVYRLE